jgi:hypothetical protein
MDVVRSSIYKRVSLFLGASLVAGACLAAEGPRYTYVEADYAHVEFDNFNNADGDQFGVGGSLGLTDMVHLFGTYAEGSVEAGNGPSIDTTDAVVGIGLNYAVEPTIDVIGRLGYVYAKAEAGNFDADDSGLGLSVGVRAMLRPNIELNGDINYVDFGDNSDTSLHLGAVFNFTEMIAMTVNTSFGEDVTSYGVGVRAYLGN